MKRIVILAIATALTVPAHAQIFDFDRPLDRGGRIADYIEQMRAESGKLHRIEGDCESSCSIWLGHRPVCVMPTARVWFHSASDWSAAQFSDGNPWRSMSATGNTALMAFYPPKLQRFLTHAGWLNSPELSVAHSLTGLELAGFGVRLCGQ